MRRVDVDAAVRRIQRDRDYALDGLAERVMRENVRPFCMKPRCSFKTWYMGFGLYARDGSELARVERLVPGWITRVSRDGWARRTAALASVVTANADSSPLLTRLQSYTPS